MTWGKAVKAALGCLEREETTYWSRAELSVAEVKSLRLWLMRLVCFLMCVYKHLLSTLVLGHLEYIVSEVQSHFNEWILLMVLLSGTCKATNTSKINLLLGCLKEALYNNVGLGACPPTMISGFFSIHPWGLKKKNQLDWVQECQDMFLKTF